MPLGAPLGLSCPLWAPLDSALGASGGLLEALLAALRALLWPLGQLLGPLGPLLAALGVVLGAPGALLGSILVSRGALFGAFWVSFRSSLAKSRKYQKTLFFRCFLRFLEVPGDPRTL